MLAVGAIRSLRVYCERFLLGAPWRCDCASIVEGRNGDETKHQ